MCSSKGGALASHQMGVHQVGVHLSPPVVGREGSKECDMGSHEVQNSRAARCTSCCQETRAGQGSHSQADGAQVGTLLLRV